jgi:hypothetical protein
MPATQVKIQRVPRDDGPLIRTSYLLAAKPGELTKYQHFDFPPEQNEFEVDIEVANQAIATGHFEVAPDSGMRPKQAPAAMPAAESNEGGNQ